MSSVSGVSGSTDLSQLLELMRQQSTQRAQQPRQQGKPVGVEQRAQFESDAKAAGIDIQGLESLHGEIETAVQGAIQGSDGTTDHRQAVQDAVDGVLKQHGFDPAQLKSQFQSMFESKGVMPPQGFDGATFAGMGGGIGGGSNPLRELLAQLPNGSLFDQAA